MAKRLQRNGMWESSRIILPEHKEELLRLRQEESEMVKTKRPPRDEFELEELSNKLMEAKEEGNGLILTVWGMEETVRGRITKLDPDTKRVHVERYGETKKIPFMDILKAETPRYL